MELKEGMYVRTEKGIGKIDKIKKYTNGIQIHLDSNILIDNTGFTDDEILKMYKFSNNLINLIEVGDYVNGECVINVDSIEVYTRDGMYLNEDITSIVTHEQFDAMKYEVK